MVLMMSMTMFMLTKMKNPMAFSMLILAVSILSTQLIYKTMSSSWLSFIVIITFSSGMMTLFMYTASIVANEKMKMKKNKYLIILTMMLMVTPNLKSSQINNTMKTFSSQTIMIPMMVILIVTMLSISTHGHHPSQTLNSSF